MEQLDKIRIVYEDKDLLVIEKPAGLVVSREGTTKVNTLEDWICDKYAENRIISRSGLVHRLDKGTSGLMVIAKNDRARKVLMSYFKERKVNKKY